MVAEAVDFVERDEGSVVLLVENLPQSVVYSFVDMPWVGPEEDVLILSAIVWIVSASPFA